MDLRPFIMLLINTWVMKVHTELKRCLMQDKFKKGVWRYAGFLNSLKGLRRGESEAGPKCGSRVGSRQVYEVYKVYSEEKRRTKREFRVFRGCNSIVQEKIYCLKLFKEGK